MLTKVNHIFAGILLRNSKYKQFEIYILHTDIIYLHSSTLQQPDAWLPVGFVWRLSRLGHNHAVLVHIQKLHEACLLLLYLNCDFYLFQPIFVA